MINGEAFDRKLGAAEGALRDFRNQAKDQLPRIQSAIDKVEQDLSADSEAGTAEGKAIAKRLASLRAAVKAVRV